MKIKAGDTIKLKNGLTAYVLIASSVDGIGIKRSDGKIYWANINEIKTSNSYDKLLEDYNL